MNKLLAIISGVVLVILAAPIAAETITYQGQLQDGGVPVTATVDMTFTLHDSKTDGSQVAGPIAKSVEVTDGLFQVDLDFGDVYGGDRWLEIEVGGDEPLEPRQRMTPVPVAVRALNVADSANAWRLDGNSGTGAGDFLGTTDAEPIELRVNGERVLYLEPTSGTPNVIGGFPGNQADTAVGATISGGGESGVENDVYDDFGAIGGGKNNQAGIDDGVADSAHFATVGGGEGNTASDEWATIGGGNFNTASGFISTVGGGNVNDASGARSTIGGGVANTASGSYSTIAGGSDNVASGDYSFAAGRDSVASNAYSFAFGRNAIADRAGLVTFTDSNEGQPSTAGGTDRFIANFDNGYRLETDADQSVGVWMGNGDSSWNSLSAREYKTNFEPVDATAVLDAVIGLDVSSWNYKWQTDIDRIGPMAGEFYQAFGIGRDDEGIQVMDAIGVLYAAVQGLAERMEALNTGAIEELHNQLEDERSRNDRLEARVAELEAHSRQMDQLAERNAELRQRMARLEAVLLEDRQVAKRQE